MTEYSHISVTGSLSPSDPNYRVGVFTSDDYYGGGFRDSGFKSGFQEPNGNQVRHFIGYLAAGYLAGPERARNTLYEREGTNDPNDPDVALGLAAIELGSNYRGVVHVIFDDALKL